jgi:Tfp pilus assembly protein PilN
MEAAKTLQLYFIRAQHQHQPSREDALRKEIIELEAESHAIDALLDKQRKTLLNWKNLLQAQKDAHIAELEQV